MNIYDTRALLAAVEQLPRDYSYLFDTFAHDAGVIEDDHAIYDYRKGSQRMAPFVVPGAGGVPMMRDGFETREIGFCTIAPERTVENIDLKNRMFGERILGAMTPEQREKKMVAKDLADMKAAIQLRLEWMVRQVLLTGKLEIFRYTSEGRDKKTTLVANYGFTNNFTPLTKWDQVGAKIEDDMKAIFDMVYDGQGYVSKMLMAPDVAAAMLENSAYIKQFDGRNINMGEINTRYRGKGIRFIGWNSDGVEMYSMSGTFTDDDGTTQRIIPNGKLIAGGEDLFDVYFGPVTQVEDMGKNAKHTTYMKKLVPLHYGDINTGAIKNRLTTCPTVVPRNVDAWAVGTML